MDVKQSVPQFGNAPPDPPLTFGGPRSDLASQYAVAVSQYTGMSRNNSGLVDPEFHHESAGQEQPREQPPYAPVDRNATSVHCPVDTTRAGLVQSSRTREPHLGDHRATTVPVAASSSRQTTASRKDIGGPEVELDLRPRGSQVRITFASCACTGSHRQPFAAAPCRSRQLSKCCCTSHFLPQPIQWIGLESSSEPSRST
jgi:hypothetical protein